MKTKNIAISIAMGVLCVPALAQTSVQIYGIADAGLEYANNVRTGALGSPTRSVSRLQSGNAASSRLGFRGKEDLGGGLAAIFTLENGFAIDTGALGNGGRLFGRQAFVGLAGNYGEIQLGRQTTTIYDFSLVFDPVAPARYSTLVFDPAFVGRADNAVKYIGKFGSLSLRGQYSFGFDGLIANGGEVAGASRVGREIGVYADYSMANVIIGAAYDKQNGTTAATQADNTERLVVGVSANLDFIKLVGGYEQQRQEVSVRTARNRMYWLSAVYQTGALTLTPAVYIWNPEGNANRSNMYTLLASQALSKRTDLYTQIAYIKNGATATIGMAGAVNQGDNQTAMTIGVRHRF